MPFSCSLLTILLLHLFISCPAIVQAAPSCIAPHLQSLGAEGRYGFPPSVERDGLVFAGSRIPIERSDVRRRILRDVNHLLQDRRSKVLSWLIKAETLRPIIDPILREYNMPREFIFLAAIESSFNSRSLSSAGAYGFWQFIKSTAVCGPVGCDKYDWKMAVNKWKDERADLKISTHAAARYLAWINRIRRVDLDGKPEQAGFQDWLLTAASYNAGPARIIKQLNMYKASSYWDAALPAETERYVPRWIALWLIYTHRDFYGVRVPPQPSGSFDTLHNVKLDKNLSINALAKMLDSTPREMWLLNSQIPPEKAVFPAKSGKTKITHTIHAPKGTKAKLAAQLAAHGYIDVKKPKKLKQRSRR